MTMTNSRAASQAFISQRADTRDRQLLVVKARLLFTDDRDAPYPAVRRTNQPSGRRFRQR